ncbi:MAG TPA: 50S ribosomal protein L25/general stress protein Ctc [Candidatus Sulfotelmatobacter sp.]|nr:50S ribosomal protein L25/general stress protein Ctc [Candidatus Sulfotelmatobacter sp.]
MSEVSSFDAVARAQAGKGEARATRRSGLVPGVIYGNKQTPVTIALDPRILVAELNKPGFYSRLFDIKLDGKVERCLCRDIQRHPVTDQALHVDFLRVSADAKVHVHVPVHFANQDKSPGLKHGGVLNVVTHEVEIVAPGNAIPDEIVVDLTGLEIGASVHVDSLKLPAGVSVVTHHKDITLATIAAPTVAPAGEEEVASEEPAAPTA